MGPKVNISLFLFQAKSIIIRTSAFYNFININLKILTANPIYLVFYCLFSSCIEFMKVDRVYEVVDGSQTDTH